MTDQRWGPRLMYVALIGGSLATIVGFTGIGGRYVWWLVLGIAIAGGFIGEWVSQRGARIGSGLLTGASVTQRRPDPPLSRVRFLIEQEKYDDALVELDQVWAAFPGRPEVVACYERVLVDRMAGPSGFAEFLEGALPKMEPVDKPYAYLRLAELYTDRIGDRGRGFLWTSRLLAEFPDSPHAGTARNLRASFKPPTA